MGKRTKSKRRKANRKKLNKFLRNKPGLRASRRRARIASIRSRIAMENGPRLVPIPNNTSLESGIENAKWVTKVTITQTANDDAKERGEAGANWFERE